MNAFERALLGQFGEENLTKIQNTRIGIAGAGGLGSNCASNLVRCGFRKIKIADFDIVDHSNLNRQFYFADQVGRKKVEVLRENLLKINPDAEIDIFDGRIEKENSGSVFEGFDILVEAFDRAENKKVFVESVIGRTSLLVSASGLAGVGYADEIRTHRIRDDFVVVGDLRSDYLKNPPISPRVNVAAAKQADVILDYVLNGTIGE
jgi:sulfur carrier protein ThiS adenylyltransferase